MELFIYVAFDSSISSGNPSLTLCNARAAFCLHSLYKLQLMVFCCPQVSISQQDLAEQSEALKIPVTVSSLVTWLSYSTETCVQIWSWYSSIKFTNCPIPYIWTQTKKRQAELIVFIWENTQRAFFGKIFSLSIGYRISHNREPPDKKDEKTKMDCVCWKTKSGLNASLAQSTAFEA